MTDLTTTNNAPLIPGSQPLIQPLGQVVHTAVIAAGRSEHTRRSYMTSSGQFFQYLSDELHVDPPLAEPDADGRKTVWLFHGRDGRGPARYARRHRG